MREGASLEARGEAAQAREAFRRSAIYYLAADWFGIDRQIMAENYGRMLPAFDAFRRLSDPPVEKLSFRFGEGSIYAHYRAPRGASKRPALLIVQGNDEVKEFNTRIEEAALGLGFSVLDLDPPGWGESFLSGTRCRTRDDYSRAIGIAVDYLSAQEEVEARSIGIMGLSLGGLLAPFAAGLEPRIAAATGLGGPSHSTLKWKAIRKRMPALQRERSYLYSGAEDENTALAWFDGMKFGEALAGIRAPVLIVHGGSDELVPPSSASENAALIGSRAELRIVPGGDHMCNATLLSETLPAMLIWLREKLEESARTGS